MLGRRARRALSVHRGLPELVSLARKATLVPLVRRVGAASGERRAMRGYRVQRATRVQRVQQGQRALLSLVQEATRALQEHKGPLARPVREAKSALEVLQDLPALRGRPGR